MTDRSNGPAGTTAGRMARRCTCVTVPARRLIYESELPPTVAFTAAA
jgi:hypothetical protein